MASGHLMMATRPIFTPKYHPSSWFAHTSFRDSALHRLLHADWRAEQVGYTIMCTLFLILRQAFGCVFLSLVDAVGNLNASCLLPKLHP